MTRLLIVESPAKAKTIASYLGSGWLVRASYGHIRDLPSKEMGVDPDDGYACAYTPLDSKKKVIAELRAAAARADEVYLATDFDREGEAIAWHIAELLGLKPAERNRITFTEITKTAITAALSAPRSIDDDLVGAQQARRVIDRLCGYTLSPLVSDWLRSRLSAGRVQSAGLKVIVDRERAIRAFVVKEFYTVKASVKASGADGEFWAKLVSVDGSELGSQEITDPERAKRFVADLKAGSGKITRVEAEESHRNPAPPFTTSSLQQEASRKLGISPKKTMELAQALYQGVDLGHGNVGLITYMRTDSVNLSEEAVVAANTYVAANYPDEYALESPRSYATKAKGAQEAHEAIRPTDILRHPDDVAEHVDKQSGELYRLIWARTVATQMAAARYDTLEIDVEVTNPAGAEGSRFGLAAKGRKLVFDGFLTLYEEGDDDEAPDGEGDDEVLAGGVQPGAAAAVTDAKSKKGKTKPQRRYTEASFIKELEKLGIGRPSTYAQTVTTLKDRGYVVVQKKKLVPTELGETLVGVLEEHFADLVEAGFTAGMETDLDTVAEGGADWVGVVDEFWRPFISQVEENRSSVDPDSVLGKVSYDCPLCGSKLVMRFGKKGKFVACTSYPDCKYAMDANAERTSETCPSCEEGTLVRRSSAKSDREFYSCDRYPNCRYLRGVDDVVTDRTCPACEKGRVLERTSKNGGVFYACELRPDCDWLEDPSVVQTDETCPGCKEGHLVRRDGKYGPYLACDRRREGCTYLRGADDKILEKTCPECGGRLLEKEGKHGTYVACEMRPACEYIERDGPGPERTGVPCPKCAKGELYGRHGSKGQFWGCSEYPKCKFTVGDRPMPASCGHCGGLVVQTAVQAQCADCGKPA